MGVNAGSIIRRARSWSHDAGLPADRAIGISASCPHAKRAPPFTNTGFLTARFRFPCFRVRRRPLRKGFIFRGHPLRGSRGGRPRSRARPQCIPVPEGFRCRQPSTRTDDASPSPKRVGARKRFLPGFIAGLHGLLQGCGVFTGRIQKRPRGGPMENGALRIHVWDPPGKGSNGMTDHISRRAPGSFFAGARSVEKPLLERFKIAPALRLLDQVRSDRHRLELLPPSDLRLRRRVRRIEPQCT